MLPSFVLAQTTSGSIAGSVIDSNQGVVANATIKISDEAKNYTLTMTSDAMGRFVFPQVPPATYTLTVEAKGFKKMQRTGILLVANDKLALGDLTIEVGAANERCLTKVFDQVTHAHRTLGWPERVTSAAKDHFLQASSIQSQMIEQAIELWQQQLKGQNWRSDAPGSRLQASTPPQFTLPTSEMKHFGEMTLNPFMLWIEAAQAWQRAWICTMSGGVLAEPSSKGSTRNTEPSTREGRSSRS